MTDEPDWWQPSDRARFGRAMAALGWKAPVAAAHLGKDVKTVTRWLAGDVPVPPMAVVLVEIWADPRCPDWARPNYNGRPMAEGDL